MKTKVENNSETEVTLTVTLDKSELADAEKVALHKLAKTLKVPGFRKGKVPASLAAKHVSPSTLMEETVENAVSKAIATAFLGEKLQVISRPDVELKKYVAGQELEFTATAEIVPSFKLGDYKKLKAPKQEKASVTKADVDEVLDRIRGQMATTRDVDRAAKDGDTVLIDFVGKRGDEAFEGGTAKDYQLALGSHSFIEGFEEGIVGHKPGDIFDLKLKFPEGYHSAELAGADVVFTVTLTKVQEQELPEVNDEFAAKVGPYTSATDLRDDIKRELTAQKEREQAEAFRDQLIEQLVDKTKVAIPKTLRDDQLQSIERDLTQNLMYRGQTLEQYFASQGFASRDEWVEKEAGPLAERRVRTGLVIAELSRAEDISVSATERKERLESLREQYAKQPDMLKQLDDPSVQRDLENRIVTEKAIERLVELNAK